MKSERERLIDLIDNQHKVEFCHGCYECPELRAASINALADHLLSNGVRLPPVKVGETVYRICEEICCRFKKCNQWCSGYDKGCKVYKGVRNIIATKFNLNMLDEIGKTVFLTREEALASLKGAKNE